MGRSYGEWRFASPLRYPGGKGELAGFVKRVLELNHLHDVHYVEPFAGGASVALSLLYEEYARKIYINDLNRAVSAFWRAVLDQTDEFCERIEEAVLSMDEWRKQRAVQDDANADALDLGFSTFYLNRTNRSGIIRGGVIGGKHQTGKWKIDARFNAGALVERVRKVGRYSDRIEASQLDGRAFLRKVEPRLPPNSLLYLDPPYVAKGSKLYEDSFEFEDHQQLAEAVQSVDRPWMVSYDYDPRLLELYEARRCVVYSLSYHAQDRYRGREIVFFSDRVEIPEMTGPRARDYQLGVGGSA